MTTLEIAARLAVLVACAVAVGALLVLVARPSGESDGPPAGAPHADARAPGADARAPDLRPIPGALPTALGAFVLVAGGTALTGAGTAAAGDDLAAALRAAGIGALALAGILAARGVARPATAPARSSSIVALTWLGAGAALVSPIVLGLAVVVAIAVDLRVGRRR